jgi:hypothetical protein
MLKIQLILVAFSGLIQVNSSWYKLFKLIQLIQVNTVNSS